MRCHQPPRRGSPSSSSSRRRSADVAGARCRPALRPWRSRAWARVRWRRPSAPWPWLVRPRGLAAGLASASARFRPRSGPGPSAMSARAFLGRLGAAATLRLLVASSATGGASTAASGFGAAAPRRPSGPWDDGASWAWLPRPVRRRPAAASSAITGVDHRRFVGTGAARPRGLRCDDRGHDRHGDRDDCDRRLRRCLGFVTLFASVAQFARHAASSAGSPSPRPGAARPVRPRHLLHDCDCDRDRHGGGGDADGLRHLSSSRLATFGRSRDRCSRSSLLFLGVDLGLGQIIVVLVFLDDRRRRCAAVRPDGRRCSRPPCARLRSFRRS